MSAPPPDVVVIGGGPAGATAATLIAREGHRVLLVDRESFPRFRVGESLMPACFWILERLGVLETLRASAYPRKHSVQFFAADGRASQPFYFSEVDSHESSVTWQVDRMTFDRMLLDHARASGVEVRERVNVKAVRFEGSRATGVVTEGADGRRETISCRVVVDASGQTALLARELGLKQIDPELRHTSIFTRYRGARRDEGIDEGATLILRTTSNRSWFWFIPLPDDQASVGLVGPVEAMAGGAPDAVFHAEVARCPALASRIEGAERIGKISAIRDFSYISDRIAGDGWVLAGDAFGFLDPIYSTGVFLALKSAELAADGVNQALAAGDCSAARLGRHGPGYLAAMESLRKLVYAFYDPSFSIASFLKRNPRCREQVVNLLIGNVFRVPPDELFEAMGHECALPSARELTPDEATD